MHPKSRKRLAHGVFEIDFQPTIVFVTVCTRNRDRWLATSNVHSRLRENWRKSTAWHVGRYVIMPDHVHLFAAATKSPIPLDNWVRYWKSQFTKQHQDANCRWQTDHWDTRMRSAQNYQDKWEYIRWNPVRARLVDTPEKWEYQGVIFDLPWD